MKISRLSSSFQQGASFLFSTQGVIYIIGKLSLIAAVKFTFTIGDLLRIAEEEPPALALAANTQPQQEDKSKTNPIESYNVVVNRDIFGRKKAANPQTTAQKPADIKLRLVGTNVGQGTKPFAIIEDTAKSEQDVFDVNSIVFGQPKLVEVARDSVKLDYSGRIVKLVLEDKAPSGGETGSSNSNDGTDFTVPEEELTQELANLPKLLSEARAVPYFRNGQSIGMRLFAIRKDSMYEKLGLENGDIIKAVNDNNLSDPSQALKIFEQLKNERSINLVLERAGADKTLHYSIH